MKNDGFDRLRSIAANRNNSHDNKIFWKFEEMGDLIGVIVGFNKFDNPKYGIQHTVEIRLADTGEIASAFMNGYIRESMQRNDANIGDKVLIQYLGRDPNANFNKYFIQFDKFIAGANTQFYDNSAY